MQSRMKYLGRSTDKKELGEGRSQSLGARSGWGAWKAVGGLKRSDRTPDGIKKEQAITCGGSHVRVSLEGEPYHWLMDQMWGRGRRGREDTSWRRTQGGLAGYLSWVMMCVG